MCPLQLRIIFFLFFWSVRNNNVIPCWSPGKFLLSFIHRRSHARDRKASLEQVDILWIYLRTLKATCGFKTPSNSRTSSALCAAGNRLCDQAGTAWHLPSICLQETLKLAWQQATCPAWLHWRPAGCNVWSTCTSTEPRATNISLRHIFSQ